MIKKVLLLRNVSPTNYGGIKKHCIELSSLFKNDEEISVLYICVFNECRRACRL